MITIPTTFTPMHREEAQFEGPVHEELVRKYAQNFNFLAVLLPVGTIAYVEINHVGVRSPDSGVWQICDGGEITLPASPLRTQGIIQRFVPNLLGRHPRCAKTAFTNTLDGTYSYSLGHNHGGKTGLQNPSSPNTLAQDGGRRVMPEHNHDIETDLESVTLDFPAAYKAVPYMKIA